MGARVAFTAWQFDSRFHALIGPISVWPIVAANGEQIFRVPANATLIAPPEPLPTGNRRLVWMESTGHWIEVSDHRGETWLDDMGRLTTIERLGDPLLWGYRHRLDGQSSCGLQPGPSCGC